MLWNSFYPSQCTLQSVFPVRKSIFNILYKIIYFFPSMIILCIKYNSQQLQMFRGGDQSLALVFPRWRRKYRSKSAQSSSHHNPHLNKSFVCRFWPKQSLSRDVYPKGNVEASSDTVCSLVYHYRKSINIVVRRTKTGFLLPLSFSSVQLTSLCSLWKIVWQVPQIISQLLQRRALSALCNCAFAPSYILCFSRPTGVQKHFRFWYHSSKDHGHCDEKGSKAHSAWRRIRAYRLHIDSRYSVINWLYQPSTQQPECLVDCLTSSHVLFYQPKICCR